MILQTLENKGLISPPKFLVDNTQYLALMGSYCYGVSHEESDYDVYGWCFSKKEMIFPNLAGKIMGFDPDYKTFDQWQQHQVWDKDALGGKGREYDFSIYSIVRYFRLLTDNNPNMVDSLFVPNNCVLHSSRIGNIVRDNRKMFLHKGAYHRFKGYAYAQQKLIHTKKATGKRKEEMDRIGYSSKYLYHLVRLCDECEQILLTGDIDLQRDNERLKAIRAGEWTLERADQFFADQEKYLEECYQKSTLQYGPDLPKIKTLLLNCLEEHFGSLDKAIHREDSSTKCLEEIKKLLELYKV